MAGYLNLNDPYVMRDPGDPKGADKQEAVSVTRMFGMCAVGWHDCIKRSGHPLILRDGFDQVVPCGTM